MAKGNKMIEFKYDQTPENTARQLAGELRGLRPLNQSKLIPTLDGNLLTVHVKGLNPAFFATSNKSRFDPVDVTSRDEAFKALVTTFGQTDVWLKMMGENETVVKAIIRPDVTVGRVGEDDKLIISMLVEIQ